MSQPRRLLPSTSALAAFEAVARRGSFTEAAEELSLTQGAVSRQIRQLEDQLGAALFERTSRHVELTPQGRLYAEAVGGALQTIRQASIRVMAGSGHQVLRLAVLPTFGSRWLMPRISSFLRANPGITLDLVSRIGRIDLKAEGIDAAIQNGAMDWPGAVCLPLMSENLIPVASPAFLRDHPITRPEDMAGLPLLHLHSRPEAWSEWFRAQGLARPRGPGMLLEQFSAAAQACIGGVGLGLMPDFLIRPELEAGDMVAVGPSMPNRQGYYLVYPNEALPGAPAERFRDWLLAELRSHS